jgi:hypothetical protein
MIESKLEVPGFTVTEMSDILKDCNHSCKLAVDILTDILAYDKLDAGDLRLHCVPVPVHRLLKSAKKQFLAQVSIYLELFFVSHISKNDLNCSASNHASTIVFIDIRRR